ncbi:MAG: transporter, family, 3-phenylpropionic acid transporter [Hydrocarboniphaga sp.]|uniref:MFS transporter n=1 Tax=Hydrocarboniphaga sp. TaxID=2033016 RepID=UPI002615890E|nr:MFS transporter [Hydrocarboniphaga sp.]MDB5968109.1 transporter, family, 3-phenylpropionic acid transporter [Hydrocarboniphaga sp.]
MFSLKVRLAAFYFCYYGTVGAFMAYWTPYLLARGLSAPQVGIAFGLMGLSRATVPILWGWWADRRGERMGMIRLAALASLLIFAAIPLVQSAPAVMALMLAYTLFWNALLPQFEVVALNHLRDGGGEYPHVRVWGSVGFVGAVLAVGPLLDGIGVLWEPWLVAVLFAGMAIAAWAVPDHRAAPVMAADRPSGPRPSMLAVMRQPAVIAMLLVCFCSQLSYAPYYNFFTVFLDRHHYSRSSAGQLWALAVVAEILLFVFAAPLLRAVGTRRLMIVALLTTMLRWLAIGLGVDSLPMLVFAQLLHASSFACYHLVAMKYVQTLFPPALHGRGQALYNSATYGLGGSIGSIASGYLWQATSPEILFMIAAGVALAGTVVAWKYLPPDQPPDP